MEISIIGCVPRVPDKTVLVADSVECYENSSFSNDSQRKVPFAVNKTVNNIDTSVSGLQSGQNAPINHVSDRVSKQLPTKEGSKNVIIVHSKDIADDEITLEMKVETEDELNLIPIVPESVGLINGICSEDVAASASVSLCATVSSNKTETSSSVASINDPSSNDSYGAESSVSLDAPSISDISPEKKKRYLFQFRPNLSKILVKNKNANTYRCFVCGGIYRQKFSLKRHYLRSHIDFRYISEADIANCKIPVPSYANEQHSNPENCKTSNGRKKFKKSVNDVFLENNDCRLMPGLYRCHDCSDVFCNTEMELKNHYNEHPDSVKKKFQCHICDASFFKKQILSRHLAGHGEKVTKNVCRKCNNVFPSKVELQRHVQSHIGQRKCKYCTKILSTSANRKRHESLHEGIKQHRCMHCDAYFAQRKDLDRHLRKQHSNSCRICSTCNKVFPTQDHMAVHIREKHTSSPKIQESPSKPEVLDKPVVSKPVAVKPIACLVCKREFHTLYAMMKHKRNAHPFHSRRRRHKKTLKRKQKEQAAKLSADLNANHKSQMRSPRAAKDNYKQGKPNGRPGPKNLTKRERELAGERAKLEEVKFYNLVHENIAENLTTYLDGKASQLSLKEYNFNDLQYSSDLEERTQVPWSYYNFPQWYDVDTALKTKGREIKLLENMSAQEELLYDATGLTPAHSTSVNNSEKNKDEMKKFSNPGDQVNGSLTLEQQKALIGKSIISIVVCCICKEKFNSYPDFNEHCANNHPNVECLFIELEGDEEEPPVVPPELCITNVSSVGFRFSCDVPPQLSDGTLKCTKCFRQFKKCSELHEHVTACGNAGTSSKVYIPPKPNPQRRIKRTMKKRMTSEQQQAALEGNGFRIFERGDSVLYRMKSNDKMALIDKQFYKTGRTQTKSLTVDMNYFNTKPKKPVSTLSKRGRKSYALVSSMYRNGTIQAARNVQSISKRGRKSYATQPFMYKTSNARTSTSRECLDCRMIFDSIQDLNNHIQSSCIMHSNKRKEMFKSTPNNVKKDLTKTTFQLPSKSLGINRFPKSSSYAGISTLGKSASSKNDIYSSEESGLEEIPIDLSRNAKFNSPLTLNRSHTGETKSAVQIAMEKALNYVEKVKNNQITQSSNHSAVGYQTTGTGLAFPIPKLVTPKKVGRPRKLKKVTPPTPLLLQNSVSPDIVKKKIINSKPGKLEETIQKLTVRSREKQLQNNLILADASSVKRNILPSSDNQLSNIPNISVAQSDICPSESRSVKEKSEALAVNIAAGLVKDNIPSDDLPPFENSTSSQNSDKRNTIENSNITNDKQMVPIKEHNDSAIENILGKDAGGNKNDTQVLPTVPNTEFSLVEPNKDNQMDNQSTNQGRSSPTFESILKVINQKLHSEEQESSHLEDTGISWLEDEQFEIPPSRSKLNISVSSSSILLLNSENPNTETKVCATKVQQDASQNILPVSLQAFCKKSLEKNSESTSASMTLESNQTASVNNSVAVESASNQEINSESKKSKMSPEIKTTTSKPNLAMKTEISIKPGVKKVTFTEELTDTSLVSLKKKYIDSSPVRRGRPGRPRKKISDTDTESQGNKNINTASSSSKADTLEPASENELVMQSDSIASDLETADLVKIPNEDGTQTNQESSLSKENNDKEILIAPNSSEYDKSNNTTETELPPLSLRNFRTKSKQALPNVDGLQSVSLITSSTTTEFGKNLASRMKEKMRLSFDPDASKITSGGAEESSLSISADTSDTNFQMSIEDLKKAVKKEGESSEKIHFCPYCMLEFAYLTNFRRHIKKCQARPDKKITDPVPGTSSTHLQHLPKKDEVDYSMLNLYRHQSRQTQMMKEVVTVDNPPIKTPISKYECTICHRIFLNLFNFMQHKTQHKLTVTKNNQENDDMIDEMDFFDNQVPENLEKFEGETSELMPSDEKEIETREGENENSTPVSSENEIRNETKSAKDEENVDQPTEVANDSVTQEIIDQGNQTVKRKKRGRPVGWRKSVNFLQENSENKTHSISKTIDKNDSALLVKETLQTEVSDGLDIFSTKLKVKNIKEMLLSKLGKLPAHKKRKLEAENFDESIPQGVTPENSLLSTKEIVKHLPKHSPLKNISVPQNDLSNASKDVPQDLKNPLLKSEKIEIKIPITETDSSSSNKRNRGRSAVATGDLKTSTAKPVSPLKRKPGRPARNLLSTPSTSQPSRSNYSQSSIRNTRKMIAVARNIDSSDSESEKKKVEVPTKKKIHLKTCALCKEKFASNLELHRHIQLVHSRRMQPVANKADTGKVLKKILPKSPPTQVSAVVRRSTSPQKKVSTMKAGCTVCKKEFHSALLLRSHMQVRHPKLQDSNITKSEILTVNSETSDAIDNKLDVPLKVDQLQPSTSIGTTEVNSVASEGDNMPKKAQKHKVCALCKTKFVTSMLLRNHLQTVHSRKSDGHEAVKSALSRRSLPAATKSGQLPISSPVKAKGNTTPDRSSLSRQCRKPLPPMKRKRIKKEPLEQAVKKSKI